MKLSIIVPVYNTAEYLEQCMDSLISQTYQDSEIILVDDGSTDGSGDLCDQYARNYENIKVIHQQNGGNVAARRSGTLEASGEYVTFVDSDDWIAEDTHEMLMNLAIDGAHDIVATEGVIYCEGEHRSKISHTTLCGAYVKGKNLNVFLSKMLFDDENEKAGIGPCLACKVIKKEIMEQVMREVDTNIVMGGDAAVFYPCCLKADSIYVINEYKFYYRVRENTVVHTYDTSYFYKLYVLHCYFQEKFAKAKDELNIAGQAKKYVWNLLRHQVNHIFDIELTGGYYLFPYKGVEKEEKIILYGAGDVGKSYKEQIRKNNYCNIVAWVDKKLHLTDENIISPMQIKEMDYSRIVIAIKIKERAEEIMDELVMLGINREKIFWEEPVMMPMMSYGVKVNSK